MAMFSMIETSLDEVQRLAARHRFTPQGFVPSVSETPWRRSSDIEAVGWCRGWLRQQPKMKTVCDRLGSYVYKHMIQRLVGVYVPNGAFIAAAYLEGFEVQRSKWSGINAVFNPSARSYRRTL